MRLLLLLAVAVTCWADNAALMGRLRTTSFISVPGVEPILRPTIPGGGGYIIEMGDILKDLDDYYLYFHGVWNKSTTPPKDPAGCWPD